ncbi:winged helix-turn-helix transcriptional regulator [Microlunatus elymi]|uniref:Winged helix-turn-helix transcriptional regulator n=1 Tax=Microlunatus elymi TaxID=2596828 RepID=A0A516PUS7_9ACTN|nr:ATP-binding protein [Microlunatus elymi]QDP94880.1 winged helix-turn-helix transcriptional regulator [Microlunatus elymi]
MDTAVLLERLRRIGSELPWAEIKAAAHGLPKNAVETVSAFANGSGGTLILGIDEHQDFAPVEGFDPLAARDALADACANKIEPPCRADVVLEEHDGHPIVRLDVPELDPVAKPCFVVARGAYGGSFIRGGDGDRRLTHYEVTQLLSNRSQPTHDRDSVPGATLDDLDQELVRTYLARVRRRSPRLGQVADDRLLIRLGVASLDEKGEPHPTLAGLLCLGEYPQQFYPQLFVSFVVLPTTRMGETDPAGRRFLDNATIDGPIPAVVADVIAMAIRNMRVGAIISGIGREDRYDYPLDVIRELVVNAIMHRDYSPDARGAQIQIELYPDRLVIKNPGGLYGPITIGDLGSEDHQSTSRNQTLAAILADVELPGSRGETLCENRGTGLLSVMAELRRVGMSPPDFHIEPGHISVTVPQHALLSPETVDWIGSLGQSGLTDAQHLALAMMRNSGVATNATLQAWGVDRVTAGEALRELVARGIALRSGGRRYASYRLAEDALPIAMPSPPSTPTSSGTPGVEADLSAIVEAIRAGHTSSRAIQDQLGISQSTASRRLGELMKRGRVRSVHPKRSSRQEYRLIEPEEK